MANVVTACSVLCMCACELFYCVYEVYELAFIIDGSRIHIGYGLAMSCAQIQTFSQRYTHVLHRVKAVVVVGNIARQLADADRI